MMINHALGETGGTRGIVQRQRLPLVLGRVPLVGIVTAIHQIFVETELDVVGQRRLFARVCIVNDDDFWALLAMLQGLLQHRPKLAVADK